LNIITYIHTHTYIHEGLLERDDGLTASLKCSVIFDTLLDSDRQMDWQIGGQTSCVCQYHSWSSVQP